MMCNTIFWFYTVPYTNDEQRVIFMNIEVFLRKYLQSIVRHWMNKMTLTTTWHLAAPDRGIWMWNWGFIAVVSEK